MSKVTAYFGMGCFWEPDKLFSQTDGVIDVIVGYAGGKSKNPTYENIGDNTETVKIIFDDSVITYTKLLKMFFENHNYSKKNIIQYRSVIFYTDISQKKKAQSIIKNIRKESKVTTKLEKFNGFTDAEDYHQDYLKKNNIISKIC